MKVDISSKNDVCIKETVDSLKNIGNIIINISTDASIRIHKILFRL